MTVSGPITVRHVTMGMPASTVAWETVIGPLTVTMGKSLKGPKLRALKLNFYGSANGNLGMACVDGIIRNEDGNIILSY